MHPKRVSILEKKKKESGGERNPRELTRAVVGSDERLRVDDGALALAGHEGPGLGGGGLVERVDGRELLLLPAVGGRVPGVVEGPAAVLAGGFSDGCSGDGGGGEGRGGADSGCEVHGVCRVLRLDIKVAKN